MSMDDDREGFAAEYALGTLDADERAQADAMMLVEKPTPVPGPGQVLVRLKAATINYRDLLTVDDLADPEFLDEARTALDEITTLLGVGSVYDFQR